MLLFAASLVTFILIAGNLYAVDGYKNSKFGISKKRLVKESSWALTEIKMGSEVTALGSEDFNFGGSKVAAFFYFIDDRCPTLNGDRRQKFAANQTGAAV